MSLVFTETIANIFQPVYALRSLSFLGVILQYATFFRVYADTGPECVLSHDPNTYK